MLKKFQTKVSQYAYLILPICTLLCLAGFIGSYLFPNEVLDTYAVNVKEAEDDEEFARYFTGAENEIGYVMETDGRALKGFQVGVSKNGAALTGTELIYRVYQLPDEVSLEENEIPGQIDASGQQMLFEGSYDLGSCLDGQYPYLPFDDSDACKGKLYLTFTYRANGNTEPAPGLFVNHSEVKKAATYMQGKRMIQEEEAEMIKHYYIYSHDTYPLLYDCRVMTFVFLAASAVVCYPRKKERGENEQ